ncbi:TetR/AcrR family transcriptional regulator [Kitasatospora sp. NPDC048540]|uniref:TetR/AcrR family transcriptional regulator n=1 Tax=Kitasatospora sp. NPDC048540 TaxID=3155634 RepID=UPI0033F638E5
MPTTTPSNGSRELGARARNSRDNLLAAAAWVLRATGYAETTVVVIARAANLSPATYYQYFATYDAIVLELAALAATDMTAALPAAESDDDPIGADELDTAVDAYLAIWRSHAPVLRAVELLASTNPAFGKLRKKINRPLAETITRAAGPSLAHPKQRAALVDMLAGTVAALAELQGQVPDPWPGPPRGGRVRGLSRWRRPGRHERCFPGPVAGATRSNAGSSAASPSGAGTADGRRARATHLPDHRQHNEDSPS